MSASEFEKEYAAYCAEHGTPERLELILCDINAVLRGKWLPADSVGKLSKDGVRLPISTYALDIHGLEVEDTGYGIVQGDPDGFVYPLPGTLRKVGWSKTKTAQVQVALKNPDGSLCDLDSRLLLQNMLARFKSLGLTPVVATELEFYLIKARDHSTAPPVPPPHSPQAQAFDLDVCSDNEDFLQDVVDNCKIQGLPSDTLIAEFGPGQFEINFHHINDALIAADYAVLFRRIVRGVAEKHGMEATFMSKPYADSPGNGMHVHASLTDDDGLNVMMPNGNGLSPNLTHCVGGLLNSMHELQAIFAPHLNSYRRFQPMSFAPSAPNWGYDHRGASVRLPETKGPGARLEHRICGADVNPYLAMTAILGGMLHGLETKPDIGLPLDDAKATPAPPLRSNWDDAVDAFETSDIAKNIFGAEFQRIYTAIRRQEISSFASIITQAEYQTYLGRF